ncbi:hypothetical protein [Acidiphilium sp.]|uniref:hypothetical protein n=1 Tax=Acidiphilium sp. TaxID=527 RepID=UPI003D031B3C
MSEAEDKKLEAAERDDSRKDATRDDAARKDSEEIPAWADALMKSHKDVMDRLDAMDRKDSARKDGEKDEGEDKTEDSDGKRKDAADCKADAERKDAERKDSEALEAADRKDSEDKEGKDREDRARKDSSIAAENRDMKAKIAALEHQMKHVYTEPSVEDRNALADARSRADSLFQSVLGRPVPEPIPGERPIAYRKRLAESLKKFSDTFKGERLDSLTGTIFDTVEERIFADAAAAVKTSAVMPAGQLRAIKSRQLGHDVTEYVGDPAAAWAPYSYGAGGKISINRGLTARN